MPLPSFASMKRIYGSFGRALLIAPATAGMIFVPIGTEVLGRQTVTLIEQKADPRTGAEGSERGFDFPLLRIVRFDDEHNLPDQRRQRGGVAAGHAGRRIDDAIIL